MRRGLRIDFHKISTLPMLWPNLNSPGVFCKKVGQGQRLCNCVNNQIFESHPGVGGTDGKEVVNFFR